MSGKIYQGSRLVAQTNDAPLGFEDKGIELENLAQYRQLENDGNLQEDVNYYIKNAGSISETDSHKFMHISFDDISNCLTALINKSVTSLWDEPFFAFLKSLHETYGAKFSLYVFADRFSQLDSTYAEEFEKAKYWLKIGIHAPSSSTSFRFGQGRPAATKPSDYAMLNRTAVQTIWNDFVDQVKLVTGSYDSVDRMPRLHYYAAPLSVCRAMQEAKCGALGFLSADDDRQYNYYIETRVLTQKFWSEKVDTIYNDVTDCVLVPTDMRGDWFNPNFTSTYNYDAPVEDNVYDELVRRNGLSDYQNTFNSLIWFAHEWQMYNGNTLNDYKQWVIDACRFAQDYDFDFDYPQNRIGKVANKTNGHSVVIEDASINLDWTKRKVVRLPSRKVGARGTPYYGDIIYECSQAGKSGYITPAIGRYVYNTVFEIPNIYKRLCIDLTELDSDLASENISFGIIQWLDDPVLCSVYSNVGQKLDDSTSDEYKSMTSALWLYTKATGDVSDYVLPTVEVSGRTYCYVDLYDDCKYITVSVKHDKAGTTNFNITNTLLFNRILSVATKP